MSAITRRIWTFLMAALALNLSCRAHSQKRYAPGANGVDIALGIPIPFSGHGVVLCHFRYIVAQMMEHVLREAEDHLTRDDRILIASSLQSLLSKMLPSRVEIANSSRNLHAAASLQPVRFNDKYIESLHVAVDVKYVLPLPRSLAKFKASLRKYS